MFVRRRNNKSGSTSVQIIDKSSGKYRVVKHIGTADDEAEIKYLEKLAHRAIPDLSNQSSMFDSSAAKEVNNWLADRFQLTKYVAIGYLEVFGKIYSEIGYNNVITGKLIQALVIARIVKPHSKLATHRWLNMKLGMDISKDTIYRLMDTLGKEEEQKISDHTYKFFRKIIGQKIHMIFFDATTLHFETFDSDSFRKTGFSKVGKHNQPQIVVGLMVTREGLPIGYDVFPGNKFDGYTIRSALSRVSRRYGTERVVFVADSGMLSGENIKLIEEAGFDYIMASRIKSYSHEITDMILDPTNYKDDIWEYSLSSRSRLVMSYSEERARKDAADRERNVEQIKKRLTKRQKITSSKMGKIGKSKYLVVSGDAAVDVNYQAIREDAKWDGLKGYVTNISKKELPASEVIGKYTQLWQVEKAFRVSKGDLQMRPIYHYKRERIRAHILLVFMSLAVSRYTEMKLKALGVSTKRLVEILETIQEITLSDRENGYSFQIRPETTDLIREIYESLDLSTKTGIF